LYIVLYCIVLFITQFICVLKPLMSNKTMPEFIAVVIQPIHVCYVAI